MTVNLVFPEDMEATLRHEAEVRGLSIEAYLISLIEFALPLQAQTVEAVAIAQVMDAFMHGTEEQQRDALAYLQGLREEDRSR